MKGIKSIIFDLGGVLLNIDYGLTINAFKDLGIKNFDEIYTQFKQEKFFDDFETGKSTSNQFRSGIKNYLPTVNNKQIDAAWNAMLLNFPKENIELLKLLKEHYKLFLLSNTNEIHFSKFNEIIYNQYQIPSLDVFFDKVYYSFLVGYRKPHLETFKQVLSESCIHADETLFIDDSKQHIEGAKRAGLNTHLLSGKDNVADALKKLGLI
ncbi:MAG: HAD family hydrolase [Flavobacteriales bacterium]|nr:HAD family phosphatase [Bacteroidales bacterium AH-315-I05]PCJ85620.1 MAG: HAD family hydrolase [Flavobacteriales bacterium]